MSTTRSYRPRVRIPVVQLVGVVASLSLVAAACTSAEGENGAEPEGSSSLSQPESAPESPISESVVPETVASWDIDVALAADPNCANPVGGDPLRIGYAADLSELGATVDNPASSAALHMANLINCSGGLEGRRVEVVVEDISGDPVATRDALNRLLEADVQVILGPSFPNPGLRVLQVTRGNIPVVFTASTEPALGDLGALSFLAGFDDSQGATAAAEFAAGNGWSRAVTFSAPGPNFGYNTLVFTEVFQASGGEVLGDFEYVPIETIDFAEAAATIATDPPDVIYSAMFASQLVALRQELDALGIQVEYLQTDLFETTGGYALPGIDGIHHLAHSSPAPGSRVVALNESLTSATSVSFDAPSTVALVGDAVAVIANAYLRSGSMDPLLLGGAIASGVEVEGVTGTLTYDGSGTPAKTIYIHKVVDGAPTLAATIDP